MSSKWFVNTIQNPSAPVQMFCFSFAGGGASVYSSWAKEMQADAEIFSVQLPGRENRFSETLLYSVHDVVSQLKASMHSVIDRPFVVFGHSLGALLAYEMTHALHRTYSIAPKRLIVSGKQSLSAVPRRKKIYDLPENLFIEELRKYKGTPEEVLCNQELRSLVLPILRADIHMFDTYCAESKPKLECPISAFGGNEDPFVFPEDLQGWAELTAKDFESHIFQGDHFFINGNRQEVLKKIRAVITA